MNTTLEILPNPEPQTAPSEASIKHPESSTIPAAPNSPNLQPSTCNLQTPCPRKLTRNGKIARLPYLERDMVNRVLRNNIPHPKIVDALDEHGITVTQRNISNWKTRGGYREWCAEQDRALETRLLQDNLTGHLRKTDASQLPEVGLQLAATRLSQYFLKAETQRQLATDPEKFASTILILCRLTRQIFNLQRYRDDAAKELGLKHYPERIKRENEEGIETTRELYSAAKTAESAREDDIPHRNYLPRS